MLTASIPFVCACASPSVPYRSSKHSGTLPFRLWKKGRSPPQRLRVVKKSPACRASAGHKPTTCALVHERKKPRVYSILGAQLRRSLNDRSSGRCTRMQQANSSARNYSGQTARHSRCWPCPHSINSTRNLLGRVLRHRRLIPCLGTSSNHHAGGGNRVFTR